MSIETKTCPFCQREVPGNAVICSCGHHFNVIEDDGTEAARLVSTEKIDVPYRWLMLAACGILIIGSLLPWGMLTAPSVEIIVKGSEGDGVLTAGIGIALLIVAFLSDKRSKDRRLAMIVGGIFSVLLLIPRLIKLLQASGFETQVYPGIILAIAGAVLLIVSAVITRSKAVAL